MSTATADYVAKRAELLAQLVLTRRKGVGLLSFTEAADTGLGLVAQLPVPDLGHDRQIQPYLNVQVQGTEEPFEDDRSATACGKRHWKPFSLFMAPAVFLLFSMEGDQGYFSWMLEPRVDDEKGPTLTWVENPEMTKITRKSIEHVFDRTEEWFKAMADILLRDGNGR